MPHRVFVWVLLFCLLGPLPLRAQDGKLQNVRDEAAAPATPENRHHTCDEDTGDSLAELLFCVVGEALFKLPQQLIGDDWQTVRYFSIFPYANGRSGHLLLADSEVLSHEEYAQLRPWAGRVDVEGSSDFSGVDRINGHLLLDTNSRVGLEGSWSCLTERLRDRPDDHMFLGDLNLVLRFAQNQRVEMRTGLGGRLATDSKATHGGVNFTYGADFYPCRPMVLSTAFDLGTLGSAGVFHGRATVGILVRRWEFFAGYDYLRIGSVNLQGPVAGLRLWF